MPRRNRLKVMSKRHNPSLMHTLEILVLPRWEVPLAGGRVVDRRVNLPLVQRSNLLLSRLHRELQSNALQRNLLLRNRMSSFRWMLSEVQKLGEQNPWQTICESTSSVLVVGAGRSVGLHVAVVQVVECPLPRWTLVLVRGGLQKVTVVASLMIFLVGGSCGN